MPEPEPEAEPEPQPEPEPEPETMTFTEYEVRSAALVSPLSIWKGGLEVLMSVVYVLNRPKLLWSVQSWRKP